jgi:ATP-dependent RNA helicase DeaD
MLKPTFPDLGLSPEILKAVEALGFEEASPIQAAAIPVLLQGRDVVGQSQTGSGKTAAFAIPAIEMVDPSVRAVQVLIMCPTRELSTQVADEVHKLTAFKRGVFAVPIYGGASYDRQFYELRKGTQIVIGTPGRLIDHLERGTLKLDQIKVAVLDEADRMLDMGFRDDIQRILNETPKSRQTVFFSATMSAPIRELIEKYSREPESIRITKQEVTVPTVEQYYYEVRARAKFEALTRLIDFHGYKLGIIFCNTQRMVDELADMLLAQGFAADRLHGGIPQGQRTRVMNKFKNAEFEFLVATDVAARGIDIDDLELVVNYDLPYDPEDYVHRIGRTGRAGRRGMAATFVSGREIYKLQFIERYAKTKIRHGRIPTQGEVENKRADALFQNIRSTLESGKFKLQDAFVDRLLEQGFNPTEIASALLHHLLGAPGETPPIQSASGLNEPANAHTESFRDSSETRRSGRAAGSPRDKERDKGTPWRDGPAVLRKPSRDRIWVRLNAGRDLGVGPRDVVDLLVDRAGLDGRAVGIVEIHPECAYAQVIKAELPRMAESVRSGAWRGASVKMEVVHHGDPERNRKNGSLPERASKK